MKKVLLVVSVLALTSCRFNENGNKMALPEDPNHVPIEHAETEGDITPGKEIITNKIDENNLQEKEVVTDSLQQGEEKVEEVINEEVTNHEH